MTQSHFHRCEQCREWVATTSVAKLWAFQGKHQHTKETA